MRRGIMAVELIASMALFVITMVLVVQLLSGAAKERRHVERQTIALEEAANLLERASALPWEQLTPGELKDVLLSPGVASVLPDVTARVTVSDETGTPAARKLLAEVHWKAEFGRPQPGASLASWVYQAAGARP